MATTNDMKMNASFWIETAMCWNVRRFSEFGVKYHTIDCHLSVMDDGNLSFKKWFRCEFRGEWEMIHRLFAHLSSLSMPSEVEWRNFYWIKCRLMSLNDVFMSRLARHHLNKVLVFIYFWCEHVRLFCWSRVSGWRGFVPHRPSSNDFGASSEFSMETDMIWL